MDLKKFLPGLDDKKEEEYFWALAIEPGWVQAGIWKIEDSKAQIVYTSPASAWQIDEELVNACDTALSSAIQDFPEEFKEPSKTVFGVAYSWVVGGEISEEYLGKIKRVCKELSLTPVGFVVLPEAISHFVKSEEGAPLNGIVLGIYKETLEVSLFKLGKLAGTTEVARSVSITEDAVEGLSRLTSDDSLPSRILIYDGKDGDLEDARQSLIGANWDDYEKLKFLHTPKIELIDTKKKVYSVALAGASEIGNATKVEVPGAVTDKVEEEPSSSELDEEAVSPEELGFALEKDVRETETMISNEPVSDPDEVTPDEIQALEEHNNVMPVSEAKLNRNTPSSQKVISNLKQGFVKTLDFTKRFSFKLPNFTFGQKPLLFGIIFFLLLIAAAGAWWWFYPTATVTIYVSPQRLEEETGITIDTNTESSSISEKKLAGNLLTASLSGEKTKDTTGTKTVGEKAKGEVTIYRVGTELSLSQGTIVYGPESLKYVMDNSVTVASGSASSPSVTKVPISAEAIGTEYNLAPGATFSVGNYSASDMEGKNEVAFSGGSSREISAVSANDQKSLKEELEGELKEKALGELAINISSDEYFLKESHEGKVSAEKFSHKVGDEANTLKLDLTIDATGISVKKSELLDLSKEILKGKIPNGFILRGEQINYSFEKKDAKDDLYEFDTRISANLLPEIKTDELAKKIAGKYPELAEDYLKRDAPGFVRAEIKMKYALPGKLKTLPHIPKNIEVEVAAER